MTEVKEEKKPRLKWSEVWSASPLGICQKAKGVVSYPIVDIIVAYLLPSRTYWRNHFRLDIRAAFHYGISPTPVESIQAIYGGNKSDLRLFMKRGRWWWGRPSSFRRLTIDEELAKRKLVQNQSETRGTKRSLTGPESSAKRLKTTASHEVDTDVTMS